MPGRCLAVLVSGMVALIVAPCAAAAWPGGDGLLALAPVSGAGVVLATPGGRVVGRVCSRIAGRCSRAVGPSWSPDGRELAFAAGGGLSIVYRDGSCADCSIDPGQGVCVGCDESSAPFVGTAAGAPVFDARGEQLVYVLRPPSLPGAGAPGLSAVGVDGLEAAPRISLFALNPPAVASSGVQPAVSVDDRLAFVRRRGGRDWIFITSRGFRHPRALVAGDAPDFSPDGRTLAFEANGSVALVGADGGSVRRLAKGEAPAWSPSGREIAFLDRSGRVWTIPAAGERRTRAGRLRARHVSWQPLVHRRPACVLPVGSRSVAQSPLVAVTERQDFNGDVVVMGCLRARGLLRRIVSIPSSYAGTDYAFGFVIGGTNVAYQRLTNPDGRTYQPNVYHLAEFNLRTGRQLLNTVTGQVDNPSGPPPPGVEHTAFTLDTALVAATGGVVWLSHATTQLTTQSTSTHTTTSPSGTTTTFSTTTTTYAPVVTYQVTVHDGLGTRALDSAIQNGTAPALTDLQLSGGTVTWLDDGQPRSAELR